MPRASHVPKGGNSRVPKAVLGAATIQRLFDFPISSACKGRPENTVGRPRRRTTREQTRVETSADVCLMDGLGDSRYVRLLLLLFLSMCIIPTLFRRSECKCTVTVTSNAPYWPAVDNTATSCGSPSSTSSDGGGGGRRRRHPFSPILFHARFSLSSPTLFPTTRHYTMCVFNLVHLIVGFVGAFVRATCSNLGLSTTIDNVVTIAATRTLLSSYANELLIFRTSDFFFFFVSSSRPTPSSSSSSSSSASLPLLHPPSPSSSP